MRLKLVLGASLFAAVVGAGLCIAIVQFVFSSLQPFSRQPDLLVIASFLLPIAAITFTSIFVYRHTARRRKLQALLTALIATVLTLLFFVGAYVLNARRIPKTMPTPTTGPRVM